MALLRRPPRGLTRHLARLPIWLYRLRLGWLLGSRFLMLGHSGRRSGLPRCAVLEVVDHDAATGAYFVAAAWGERSDWLRNVEAHPDVEVTVGRRRFTAAAQLLPPEQSEGVLLSYAARHRLAARALARALGYPAAEEMARAVPVVALRPRTP